MRPDEARAYTEGDDSRRAYEDRSAARLTLHDQDPDSHPASRFKSSWSNTPHYGERLSPNDVEALIADYLGSKQATTSTTPPLPAPRTPPRSPRLQDLLSYDNSGLVTKEEHDFVLKQKDQLIFELQHAVDDRDRAEQALRDLAAWTDNERTRLTREIEEKVRMKEAMLVQQGVLYIERKFNEMREEVGLPQLSPAEMNVMLEIKLRGWSILRGDGENDTPPAVEVDAEVAEQVEELIAEEKGRMASSE